MNEFYRKKAERLRTDFASAMLLTYIYIYIYIYIVPDTSGESKNNIGPPSGGPKKQVMFLPVLLCVFTNLENSN